MHTRIRWLLWFASNIQVPVTLPRLFAHWISHSMQKEYRLGLRVTTDGDSIGLPIAGFTILPVSIVAIANLILGFYWLIQPRRRGQSSCGPNNIIGQLHAQRFLNAAEGSTEAPRLPRQDSNMQLSVGGFECSVSRL